MALQNSKFLQREGYMLLSVVLFIISNIFALNIFESIYKFKAV